MRLWGRHADLGSQADDPLQLDDPKEMLTSLDFTTKGVKRVDTLRNYLKEWENGGN